MRLTTLTIAIVLFVGIIMLINSFLLGFVTDPDVQAQINRSYYNRTIAKFNETVHTNVETQEEMINSSLSKPDLEISNDNILVTGLKGLNNLWANAQLSTQLIYDIGDSMKLPAAFISIVIGIIVAVLIGVVVSAFVRWRI